MLFRRALLWTWLYYYHRVSILNLITDFNQELWQTSVERLDIKEDKKISLTFKNGLRIDL
ncbi:TPA: hypothetical protein U1W00_002086 [Streptococcus suis]|nr:hypothetical protein [Streptococcus suis]